MRGLSQDSAGTACAEHHVSFSRLKLHFLLIGVKNIQVYAHDIMLTITCLASESAIPHISAFNSSYVDAVLSQKLVQERKAVMKRMIREKTPS
jgi:hypothetical protein